MAGKLDSALKSLRRAVEILERLDRQYPGVLNYRGGLASTYNMMSDLHRRRREPAESLAFAEKARALLERLVAEHPEDIYSRIDLAKATTTSAGCTSSRASRPRPCDRSSAPSTCYESLPELDPRNSYNLACNLALCIPLIGAENGTQGTLDAEKLSKGDRFRRREVRRPGRSSSFAAPSAADSSTRRSSSPTPTSPRSATGTISRSWSRSGREEAGREMIEVGRSGSLRTRAVSLTTSRPSGWVGTILRPGRVASGARERRHDGAVLSVVAAGGGWSATSCRWRRRGSRRPARSPRACRRGRGRAAPSEPGAAVPENSGWSVETTCSGP